MIRGQHILPSSGDHTHTMIWLHGLGGFCSRWKTFLITIRTTNMKVICLEAAIIPVTAEFTGTTGTFHPSGKTSKSIDLL